MTTGRINQITLKTAIRINRITIKLYNHAKSVSNYIGNIVIDQRQPITSLKTKK